MNAQKLNEIGIRLGEEYEVPYLKSDFKKKNGYKRSDPVPSGNFLSAAVLPSMASCVLSLVRLMAKL